MYCEGAPLREPAGIACAARLRQQPAFGEEAPTVISERIRLRAVAAPAVAIETEMLCAVPVEPSEVAAGAFPRGMIGLAVSKVFQREHVVADEVQCGHPQRAGGAEQLEAVGFHCEEAARRRAAALDDHRTSVRAAKPMQAIAERVEANAKCGVHRESIVSRGRRKSRECRARYFDAMHSPCAARQAWQVRARFSDSPDITLTVRCGIVSYVQLAAPSVIWELSTWP